MKDEALKWQTDKAINFKAMSQNTIKIWNETLHNHEIQNF